MTDFSEPKVPYRQTDRARILERARASGGVFRKKSRIVAFQSESSFTVTTDRGVMTGEPGDWVVTNHPDDDPGSDIWTISAERMAATYEPVDEPDDSFPGPDKQPGAILADLPE